MAHEFIYLASQSPRRRQLLEQLGVRHELLLPGPEEDAEALEAERPGEAPAAYVERVTRAKLAAARTRLAARRLAAAPILCSDTTVAKATLRLLSGRTHRVITAVALAWGRRDALAVNVSRVQFADVSERDIAHYVATGEPFGKAGAYAIQSAVAAWVERIDGSYSGIMGLPLYETARLLRRAGVEVG